ncbi:MULTISPECIES: hypothetical protein [Metabacillus]|uniref:hypothetical protein n=1 Tax=Metabacillus TaxID=2675233 RepID=UPI000C7F99FE|nr:MULTISPECIES: hypothetical protein [Metabacillus]MCM3443993.1 hypothetical protein [Metabacillus halosaccharovorans]PMC34956.1 hypothetical protein CJ195_20830 [Bacillus sp. UMB0899]
MIKKFIVVKCTAEKDYLHSIIKANNINEAAEKLSEEIEKGIVYRLYPLVNFYFDDKGRIVLPEGTKSQMIMSLEINN